MQVLFFPHALLAIGLPPRPAVSLPVSLFRMANSISIALFDLQGGMVDIEMMAQIFRCLVEEGIVASEGHDQMRCQDVFRGAGGPDVQVMDADHFW